MKRLVILIVAALAVSPPASADAPGNEVPISAFLERRVPEELAAEGVVLSRRNLTLKIEAVGDELLLSIADASTGRVAASTKLEVVPQDREAAVAATTHLVADLITQMAANPAAPTIVVVDDRAERMQHAVSEQAFKRDAISFGDDYDVTVNQVGTIATASVNRHWVAYQGDLHLRLDPEDFYRGVGRPDLADQYVHRRQIALGAGVVGVSALLVSGALLIKGASVHGNCPPIGSEPAPGVTAYCFQQESAERSSYLQPGVYVAIGALIPIVISTWYRIHKQPVSENEAKALADGHNKELRRQLGLPVAEHAPRLRDVKIAPLISASGGGGLALSGAF